MHLRHGTPFGPGLRPWLAMLGICILSGPAAGADWDVDAFCRAWDRSMDQGLASGPGAMLGRLIARDRDSAAEPMTLRYTDERIVSRVVDLFIAECQFGWRRTIAACRAELDAGEATPERRAQLEALIARAEGRLATSRARHGDQLQQVPASDPARGAGELEMDYRDQLSALALSTFEPRLYDYLWYPSMPGSREAVERYFARVRTEETIRHLTRARLGENHAAALPPVFDTLYRRDEEGEMDVVRAMDALLVMARREPASLEQHRPTIRDLIARCRDVYWQSGDTAFNRRYQTHNYRLRKAMIRLLGAVGTARDVALVESLAENTLPHSDLLDSGPLWDSKAVRPITALAAGVVASLKADAD